MGETRPPEEPARTPAGVFYAPLPVPGNAEVLVYLLVVAVLVIIWAASAAVDAQDFVVALTALTVGYLLSRGIAKASRVAEH